MLRNLARKAKCRLQKILFLNSYIVFMLKDHTLQKGSLPCLWHKEDLKIIEGKGI